MTRHEQLPDRDQSRRGLSEAEHLRRETRVACSHLVRSSMFDTSGELLNHIAPPTDRDKDLLLGGASTLQAVLRGTVDEASMQRTRAVIDLGHEEASRVVNDYIDAQSLVDDAEVLRDSHIAYTGLSAGTTVFGTLTFYALFKNDLVTQGIGVAGTTAMIYFGAKLSKTLDVLKEGRKRLQTQTRTARYIAGLTPAHTSIADTDH